MKKPESATTPDPAFQALVRAQCAGNPRAMTTLGARLVVGRETPAAPADGAALIAQAAQEGDSEAWSYVAMLAAAGVGRVQSWADSLAALHRAANLGDPKAARQMQILRDIDIRDARGAKDWLCCATAQKLSSAPRLVTYQSLLTQGLCSYLIERSAPKLVRAQVYDASRGVLKIDSMRTNSGAVFSLIETDVVIQLIRGRIAYAADVAMSALEPPETLHYAVGECYKPHVDFFHPALPNFAEQMRVKGQRVMTCLIYLNDDYEGGETDFPKIGIKFRGRVGEGLMFHNVRPNGTGDMATLHTGLAPTRGEKWLFSQWIRNKAQPIA